jgi:hypothetical protein
MGRKRNIMTRKTGRGGASSGEARRGEPLPGIVIAGADRGSDARAPRIAAFIWGGKIRPTPTLPYGRWKGVA